MDMGTLEIKLTFILPKSRINLSLSEAMVLAVKYEFIKMLFSPLSLIARVHLKM